MARKYNVNKFFKNILETESIDMDSVSTRIKQNELVDYAMKQPIVNQKDIDALDLDLINSTISELTSMTNLVNGQYVVDVKNPLADAVAVNKAKDFIRDIPKIPMIDTLDYF